MAYAKIGKRKPRLWQRADLRGALGGGFLAKPRRPNLGVHANQLARQFGQRDFPLLGPDGHRRRDQNNANGQSPHTDPPKHTTNVETDGEIRESGLDQKGKVDVAGLAGRRVDALIGQRKQEAFKRFEMREKAYRRD